MEYLVDAPETCTVRRKISRAKTKAGTSIFCILNLYSYFYNNYMVLFSKGYHILLLDCFKC